MSGPDGSLAGVAAVTTAIAHVDGKKGVALVHGYPLPELARQCSYEEVAMLVLDGELPAAHALAAFRLELVKGARTSRLPPALSPTAASLPESLVAAVACTGDIEPQATRPVHVLARMPDACALAAGRAPPPATLSYAARGLRALGARRLDAQAERALEVLLILEAEHGLSASTFATRVAASSGASLPAALAAGAATLGGPRHGGATEEVHAFLRAAIASGDVAGYARRQTRIPGFGHRVYKVPDPRAPPLLDAIRSLGTVPLSAAAAEVEEALRPRLAPKGVHANIDYHAAVLLDAVGVPPSCFVAAFAMGIACGWLAHAVEQRTLGRLIRPDSVYSGPPLRAVPVRPRG